MGFQVLSFMNEHQEAELGLQTGMVLPLAGQRYARAMHLIEDIVDTDMHTRSGEGDWQALIRASRRWPPS
jgi:hypothetical protein